MAESTSMNIVDASMKIAMTKNFESSFLLKADTIIVTKTDNVDNSIRI